MNLSAKTIEPFIYKGNISAPKSKSYLQRAIAIAVLSGEAIRITGFTPSDDVVAAINIARELGSKVQVENDLVEVSPRKSRDISPVYLNCHEAGLSTRMFSPISAALYDHVIVNGKGSILSRPMDMIEDALRQLGASVSLNKSLLPLTIKQGITAGNICVDGSESSQLLTGLLITLPFLDGDSSVYVKNVKSIPYIQMTIDTLKAFGIDIQNHNYHVFKIKGGQKVNNSEYNVEGDWSGASFHVVGAAISASITIHGLNPHSAQADLAILDALKLCGAHIEINDATIYIRKDELKSFAFDATNCPDLFPPLAALAACCEGTSIITGVHRLKHKESDRALAIQEELGKLGIEVLLDGDEMKIKGGKITGGIASSRNDHRIAMMLSVLASVSSGPITIENPEAINKSYPDFFNDLEKLNRDYELIRN